MSAFGAKHWTAGPVCIDELVTVMAEYPTDVRWNGFLCPFMDPVAVNKVMAALHRDHGDQPSPTHEWRDNGTLVVTQYDGDTAYPEEMEPNEDGLYPLGAYEWVWSEDEQPVDPDVLTLLGRTCVSCQAYGVEYCRETVGKCDTCEQVKDVFRDMTYADENDVDGTVKETLCLDCIDVSRGHLSGAHDDSVVLHFHPDNRRAGD